MAYDSVRIDPGAAGAALRSWQETVEGLRRRLGQHAAAIEAAEAARPWGGDNGGPEFAVVYREGAEPSWTAAQATVDDLEHLGTSAGTAIQASLASDEVQAAALAPVQTALDGAADPRV